MFSLWKRLQNKILEEQRANLAQLNNDRSQLAAERAEFDVKCKLRMEEQQNKLTRAIQVRIHPAHTPLWTRLIRDFIFLPFSRKSTTFQ